MHASSVYIPGTALRMSFQAKQAPRGKPLAKRIVPGHTMPSTIWDERPWVTPMTSMYREQFANPDYSHRNEPYSPPRKPYRPTKFEDNSTYREDFVEYRIKGGVAHTKPEYPAARFNPKLSPVTIARQDFQTPEYSPTRSAQPARKYTTSDAPLETTTSRADYKEWKIHRRGDPKPAIVPPQYVPKPYFSSTARSSYQEPAEIPNRMDCECSPPTKKYVRPVFDGSTEYRESFVEHRQKR